MTAPSYPKALASWTDRVDEVDTVFARDPNSLAAEILSVEKALGTMPQVESPMPVGNPVTYSSVSSRINAAMTQAAHPFTDLYNANFRVGYGTWNGGVFNKYRVVEDDCKYFNGSDITIQADGVYLIDAYQTWTWHNNGWVMLMLAINNVFARGDRWNWGDFPASGPHDVSYKGRWGVTAFTWMGRLEKGARVRVASENATTNASYLIVNSTLKMYYLRGLSHAEAVKTPSTFPV